MPPSPFKINQVNIQQVHLLQKISKETFLEAFAEFNTSENLKDYFEKAFSIESLIHQIKNTNSRFYFVHQNQELCAYFKINIGKSQTEIQAEDGLELERIYIYKKFQNLGLGKIILNEVKIKAILDNKKYIWLGVWEHNLRAIKFYQNYGFQKFDSHIYVMGDDPQTDWMMNMMI
jgi:ribosomal protein S18 acetylase RimI-like enzyme